MSVQPKYQQIREELTREIAAGVFASGEKLPTEEHLARQFGVARQTVLKALDAMKLEGVITSERGRGTFVAVTHGRKRSAQENCRQLVFISSNLEESFGHRVLLGVERAARQIGCSLVTCNTRNDSEREAEYLRRARNTGADGIILLPYLRHPNGELVSRVAESVPLVCVDNVPPGVTVPLVTTDNFRAAHDAVLRLIDMRHRNIGFILSRMEYAAAPGSIGDRYRGYRRALEERGIEFRPEWVAELGPHLAEARPQDIGLELYGYPAMHRLMSCEVPPTAVLLLWDELGPGALAAIRNGRRRVPEDFSLLGFNDDDLCSLTNPMLSSVRQPAEELGETAVQLLDDMRRGIAPPPVTRLKNHLILRDSIAARCEFEHSSNLTERISL